MDIIPAIDLMGGKCVRLYQGDYGQQTVFDEDPASVAVRWKQCGARWVHVVDLDGSKLGRPVHLRAVEQIVSASGLRVEYGGGVRESQSAVELFSRGVARVVLGTVAVDNPGLVATLAARFGERIAVSLDAKYGRIAIQGWRRDTTVEVQVLAESMAEIGVRWLIYTDIRRDGTLTEPNFDAVRRLVDRTPVPVIASGGISQGTHVQRLREMGVAGVIIGRALYTGDLDLGQMILDHGG
ncbi:MAG: 1-(5-phosphoribosyl)-5-[(5-phosphoribosylamino)methylideneamino]imidazole-4-carboxamide isomerase [bacterium]